MWSGFTPTTGGADATRQTARARGFDCHNIGIAPIDLNFGEGKAHTCDNAFHEKAGRSQVDFVVSSLDKFFLPPSHHYCRHPSIRTLR